MKRSDDQIDEIVEREADDSSAWDEPVFVGSQNPDTAISIPGDLAARAGFLARAHREGNAEEWLARIIRERIELEELAFAEAKREMASR